MKTPRRCYRCSWTAYYSQRRRQANEDAKTAGKAALEVFMGSGDLRSTCTEAMEQQRDAKAVQQRRFWQLYTQGAYQEQAKRFDDVQGDVVSIALTEGTSGFHRINNGRFLILHITTVFSHSCEADF